MSLLVASDTEGSAKTRSVTDGPTATTLMIADWGALPEHISLIKPVFFEIAMPDVARHLVCLPVILLGTQREYEGHGRTRAIRGIHAAKFAGNPRTRPNLLEAQVLIREFDLHERRGRLVCRSWLDNWLVERCRSLTKDDDGEDFR